MPKQVGRRVNIGIGKESSRGTAVAPTFWIPWKELDFNDRYEVIMNDSARGIIEEHDGASLVKEWGEGTLTGKLKDDSFGLVLLSLMGTVSSALASGETAVYEHTFSVEQSAQHQSLTVAIKDDNIDLAFPNSVISSIELTAELGEYVMYNASVLSKKSETASNTVSQGDETDFVPQDMTFSYAADKGSLPGTTQSLKSMSLTISSQALTDDVLGTTDPEDVLNTAFNIEGSLEMNMDATTFKDFVSGENERALRILLSNTETIGNAENPSLQIDLARVRFKNWEENRSLNDIVTQTVEFQALYSTTDSEMIEAILTNETSSY